MSDNKKVTDKTQDIRMRLKSVLRVLEWGEFRLDIKGHTVPKNFDDLIKKYWFLIREKFFSSLNQYPDLLERYNKYKESYRWAITSFAEENIYSAISWKKDLSDKEVTDYSFRFLEKTNKAYNPSNDINIEAWEIRTWEEIFNDLLEILWKQ